MLFLFGVLFFLVIVLSSFFRLSGNVADNNSNIGGPSNEQISCMQNCVAVGCEEGNMDCKMANSKKCGEQCNVDVSGKPEPADEGEACMQECVEFGCDKFDFTCQNANMEKCEVECNMKGDAPDESEMSAEQLCISKCVAEVDSTIICGNSQEGETGGEVCQKCASDCVNLYEGPCLDDEKLTEKKKECEICEHCYGEPVEGPSGEGWDCIVDVECKDASAEFGDNAGEGPDSFEEGHENSGIVSNVVGKIGDFFKGLFGGEK